MSSENHSHTRRYVAIWGWLLIALIVSVVVDAADTGVNGIFVIFSIAVAKAYLVITHFMHLHREPRTYKLLVWGVLFLMVALVVGVYPDVVGSFGRPEARASSGPVEVPEPGEGDVAAGATVYKTYCQACHQPDGRGKGGKMAADFVGDASRLAKDDHQLLTSITRGVTGKVGAMPAWGSILNAQQQRDVLAYVRASFGQ